MLRHLRVLGALAAFLLTAAPAGAEPPAGDYSVDVADPPIFLPRGVPANDCDDVAGVTICFDSFLLGPNTSGAGNLGSSIFAHAAGDLQGNLGGAFLGSAPLFGKISGPATSPKARLSTELSGLPLFGGVPVAADVRVGFRCSAEPPFATMTCRGSMRVCASESFRQIGCASSPVEYSLTLQGGPWKLRLKQLATDTKGAITGTGEVELALTPPQIVKYAVTGKYDSRSDTATLRLAGDLPTDAAKSKVVVTHAALSGGTLTSGRVVFRVAGQSGRAELGAAP